MFLLGNLQRLCLSKLRQSNNRRLLYRREWNIDVIRKRLEDRYDGALKELPDIGLERVADFTQGENRDIRFP